MKKIDYSIERIRGETHRHHHFDFHSRRMKHNEKEPYHDFCDGCIYEDITKIARGTKISNLITKAHAVITQISNYQLINAPYIPDGETWNYSYILRNIKRRVNYLVSIKKDATFSCNCPAYINDPQNACKHIIIAAILKNHEINI